MQKNISDFIKDAINVHGSKYDYSKVNYINNHTKVIITCRKHGDFEQTPNSHLNGRGCPKCKSSHLENNVRNILKEKNILFIEQKRFDWLGQLSLDFYIPSIKTAIECQGIQHFTPRDFAYKGNEWSNELYEKIIERDSRKNKLCKENGIKLIYFTDCDDKIINEGNNKELYHDIIKSNEKLKEYINNRLHSL